MASITLNKHAYPWFHNDPVRFGIFICNQLRSDFHIWVIIGKIDMTLIQNEWNIPLSSNTLFAWRMCSIRFLYWVYRFRPFDMNDIAYSYWKRITSDRLYLCLLYYHNKIIVKMLIKSLDTITVSTCRISIFVHLNIEEFYQRIFKYLLLLCTGWRSDSCFTSVIYTWRMPTVRKRCKPCIY